LNLHQLNLMNQKKKKDPLESHSTPNNSRIANSLIIAPTPIIINNENLYTTPQNTFISHQKRKRNQFIILRKVLVKITS